MLPFGGGLADACLPQGPSFAIFDTREDPLRIEKSSTARNEMFSSNIDFHFTTELLFCKTLKSSLRSFAAYFSFNVSILVRY